MQRSKHWALFLPIEQASYIYILRFCSNSLMSIILNATLLLLI
jgi:hypothetical protein